MKPETLHFIEQAKTIERRARKMMDAGLNEDAGRCAYLVCFHAAQGLIFEMEEKVVKTHRGVHSEYHRLAGKNPCADPSISAFLPRAYDYKAEADYFRTPGYTMTSAEAAEAIEIAGRFVAQVLDLMTPREQAPTP